MAWCPRPWSFNCSKAISSFLLVNSSLQPGYVHCMLKSPIVCYRLTSVFYSLFSVLLSTSLFVGFGVIINKSMNYFAFDTYIFKIAAANDYTNL